jgi:hypothetical protein
MKKINPLIIGMLLLMTACGGSSSGGTRVEQAPAQAGNTEERSFEVKVLKNGAEFVSYSNVGERSGCALFEGSSILLELQSPDNKHLLMVEIRGGEAGTYPLPVQYESAKSGEAALTFTPEVMPILIPAEGEVRLDEFTDQSCSGSFSGGGTDIEGDTFSIEGRFSKMIVRSFE